MSNLNLQGLKSKFLNRLFRQVGGVVWDLTTGSLGYRTADGVISYSPTVTPEIPGTDTTPAISATSTPGVAVNLLDFSLELPAFGLSVPLSQVEEGDVLVGANSVLGFITKVSAATVEYIKFDGHVSRYNPPKVSIVGNEGQIQVVKSLTSMLGDNKAGFDSQLMPLLLLSKSSGDTSALADKLPLLLLAGMGGALTGGAAAGTGTAAAANPFGAMGSMLPLLLLGGDKAGGMDAKTLLLMQAMGGGAGAGMSGMLPFLLLGDSGKAGGLDMESLLLMQALGGATSGGTMNPLLLALLADKGGDAVTTAAPALTPIGRSGPPPLTRI